MASWRSLQFGSVLDDFKLECGPDAWDDLLMAYGVLRERGPACGSLVAKKLVNGKGIWELIGHAGSLQPRPLFYFRNQNEIVFVHAFMKKGKKDYRPAIELAQRRRKMIERGERIPNVIEAFKPHVH